MAGGLVVLPREITLGERLGTGLSHGLQALANLKMQRLAQRQAIGGLQSLGLTPQVATGISALEPRLQQEALKQQLAAPGQQAYLQGLQAIMGVSPQAQTSQQDIEQPLAPPAGLTQQQATELAKLQMQKQKMASREKSEAFKATKDIRTKLNTESRTAKEDDMRLDRMYDLNKEGKLNTPFYVAALQKLGLDIPALLNPDSQEFQRLSIDFLRNAKSYFGSRVTQYEVQMFLKSIPSLLQSKEGRDRVIRNLKIINEGKAIRAKEMRKIIRENNGIPPLDLEDRVEERVSDKLDKLASKFNINFENIHEGPGKKELPTQGVFASMPKASSFKAGTRIKDEDTGKVYVTDGFKWILSS